MNGKVCYDMFCMRILFVSNKFDVYKDYIELNPEIKDCDIYITNLRLDTYDSPPSRFFHGIRYQIHYINCVWV